MRGFLICLLSVLATPVYSQSAYLPFAKFPPAQASAGDFAYAKFIVGLHQSSLFDFPSNVDIYRFIEQDSFQPGYMALIVKKGDKVTIEGIQPAGDGEHSISGVASDTTRTLTSAEWRDFQRYLSNAHFAAMKPDVSRPGNDGSTFTLEARVGGKYHYVMRWEPEDYAEDRAFSTVCSWFSNRIQKVGTVTTESGDTLVNSSGNAIILGK